MTKQISSFNKRLEALRSDRTPFISYWGDLSDHHLAHRGRFLLDNGKKNPKRNTKQLNNTSRQAVRTLASGMMAGITSPARPWFRLGSPDPAMRDNGAIRTWLHAVENIMYAVFSQSNTYNSLNTLYAELGTFGTAAIGVYDDFENVIRCRTYTVGSYMLGMNGKEQVDTFYREYSKTVGEVVKEFGIDNCSRHVQDQWKSGNLEQTVQLVHAIEPNDDRDMMSPLAANMPVRSVYYEKGNQTQKNNRFLKKSGFHEFAILAPRWDVTPEDVYAVDCPGMTALGDTKALQLGERRMYQVLDKLTDPPTQGPSNVKNDMKRLKPGDHVAVDGAHAGSGIKSIYDQRPDLNAIVSINDRTEVRINKAFYVDLFLMLASSDRRQITAREVAEKHEEKLLMLGPVLERLHSELLDPLIDITFNKLLRAGVLPPPPPELEGVDLRVEYVSVLAQAQRMVSVGGIDRMAGFIGELAAAWPEARYKFNAMEAVDEYADALGVAPKIINDDETAQGLFMQEQQAMQSAQMAEMAGQIAGAAKTASETDTSGENALTTLLRNQGLQ